MLLWSQNQFAEYVKKQEFCKRICRKFVQNDKKEDKNHKPADKNWCVTYALLLLHFACLLNFCWSFLKLSWLT